MILLSLVFLTSPLCSSPTAAAEKPSAKTAGKNAVQPVVDPLVTQVIEAIEVSKYRFLTANVHTPWQIMHGVLALRQDYTIKDQSGKKIKAIDFISSGAAHRGQFWFQKTRYGGRAHPYSTDYIFEGHPCQFLAILSMAKLPLSHKLKADRGTITIADMVNHATAEVNADQEITWT
ncbi:MAG: hypothetical protein IID45_14880, partial [Planctomycetes bacterium]|nr:hypothetical protein [Planctomycetota bacterium]